MKLLDKNPHKGFVKVQVDSLDDLWYLSHVIDVGDLVSGRTFRKIKIGEEPNVKVVKKPVFLKLVVEKVDFEPESDSLRVLGTVDEGLEDIPKGSHHSFGFELNDSFTIFKKQWMSYQLEKLEDAAKPKSSVLVLVLDRDEACFALLKGSGYEVLTKVSGEVQKKDFNSTVKGSFFESVANLLKEYFERYKASSIIVGSPGFWKQEFVKVLPSELSGKVIFASCSSSGESGIVEVLKRDEVKAALAQDRTSREMAAVDALLSEISKGGKVVYGIKETRAAAEMGAVEVLYVTDGFLKSSKAEGSYGAVDSFMKVVEQARGRVLVIGSDHDGGKRLDGLGGVGALLRFKVE